MISLIFERQANISKGKNEMSYVTNEGIRHDFLFPAGESFQKMHHLKNTRYFEHYTPKQPYDI